jgi:hypothetical protein
MQEQEAGMVVKQRGSATKGDGGRSSVPADVIASVADIVAKSQAAAAHVPKETRRQIRKLGRQFDAARATEAKRLRQAARLRLEIEKRERQAADAAAVMTSIVSTIRDVAKGAIGSPTPPKRAKARPAATKAASARKPAARGTATKSAAATAATKPTARSAAAKPAGATRPAPKPAAAKAAGAAKPATAAKAPTRRGRATTPQRPPATRGRSPSTRTTKRKPTA